VWIQNIHSNIDGITVNVIIAQWYADFLWIMVHQFMIIIMLICPILSLLCIMTSDNTNIKHVDVEMVSKWLAKMKKFIAPGWAGLGWYWSRAFDACTSYLNNSTMYFVQCNDATLCCATSIQQWNHYYNLKDKKGNATDINN